MTIMKARAAALIVKEGQVLLIERHKQGEHYFVLPGGGIESGESAEVAVKRELSEELGVSVTALSLLGIVDAGRLVHLFDAMVAAKPEPSWQEMHLVKSDNTYLVCWRPIDQLSNLDLRPRDVRNYLIAHLSGD